MQCSHKNRAHQCENEAREGFKRCAKHIDATTLRHKKWRSSLRVQQNLRAYDKQRSTTPEFKTYRRAHRLKTKYGLTTAQWDSMFEAQGKRCAVCGSLDPKDVFNRWSTDHDHACCPTDVSCGKCIRGILCSPCNLTLGQVRDSLTHLDALKNYLIKWQSI